MLSRVVICSARSSLKLARPLVNYGLLYSKKYSSDPSHHRAPVTDHPIVTNDHVKDKQPKEQPPTSSQGADVPNSQEHRPSHAPPPHDDAPTSKPATITPPSSQQSSGQQTTQQSPQPTTPQAPKSSESGSQTQTGTPKAQGTPINTATSGTPELTGPPPPSMPFSNYFFFCAW
jgi:hypothetical protein